ncbi:MAG: hypothetical protein V3S14_12460, partial [Anaerolineae bacterium]
YAAELCYKLSMTLVKWPLFEIYGIIPGGHVAFFNQNSLIYFLNKNNFEFLCSDFDAMGQALWRPVTWIERLAGAIDNVGSVFSGKYHMVVFARSGERNDRQQEG